MTNPCEGCIKAMMNRLIGPLGPRGSKDEYENVRKWIRSVISPKHLHDCLMEKEEHHGSTQDI